MTGYVVINAYFILYLNFCSKKNIWRQLLHLNRNTFVEILYFCYLFEIFFLDVKLTPPCCNADKQLKLIILSQLCGFRIDGGHERAGLRHDCIHRSPLLGFHASHLLTGPLLPHGRLELLLHPLQVIPQVEILPKKPRRLEAVNENEFQAGDKAEVSAKQDRETAPLLLRLVEIFH